MNANPLAGILVEPSMLVDFPRLVSAFFTELADPSELKQRIAFGTSGHCGSSPERAFNEQHTLAISQAICLYRELRHIDGPPFLRMHTHTPSVPAFATALEVLAARTE